MNTDDFHDLLGHTATWLGGLMDLRRRFLDRLVPEYRWVPLDDSMDTVLITHYRDSALDPIVRLDLLTEEAFADYLRRLAASSESGDEDAALGLMFVHLDEEIAAVTTRGLVSRVGLRSRRLRRPEWFVERISSDEANRQPRLLWTADPSPPHHP